MKRVMSSLLNDSDRRAVDSYVNRSGDYGYNFFDMSNMFDDKIEPIIDSITKKHGLIIEPISNDSIAFVKNNKSRRIVDDVPRTYYFNKVFDIVSESYTVSEFKSRFEKEFLTQSIESASAIDLRSYEDVVSIVESAFMLKEDNLPRYRKMIQDILATAGIDSDEIFKFFAYNDSFNERSFDFMDTACRDKLVAYAEKWGQH